MPCKSKPLHEVNFYAQILQKEARGVWAAPVDLQLVDEKVRTQADTCYVYPASQDIKQVQGHAYRSNSPAWERIYMESPGGQIELHPSYQ